MEKREIVNATGKLTKQIISKKGKKHTHLPTKKHIKFKKHNFFKHKLT